MSEANKHYFSSEEVEQILRRAMERRSVVPGAGISLDTLRETASELGISEDELATALEEQARFAEFNAARQEWRRRLKKSFMDHLRSYAIVNSGLFLFNLFTPGRWFFIYPLLGWGIGLAFHAFSGLYPSDEELDKGARTLLKKVERERARINSTTARKKSEPQSKPGGTGSSVQFDSASGKIVISHGDKRIEIG